MAIHPSHIPIIDEVFSPSSEELTRYTRLVAAVEEVQTEGMGAVLLDGEMVDEAMAVTARRVLRRHGPQS